MMTIDTPNSIPPGLHRMYQVKDEAEAEKIADGRKSYFYRSHIITACYLFVPVENE